MQFKQKWHENEEQNALLMSFDNQQQHDYLQKLGLPR